ncbi:MAG: sensor histidine kinase, partial [Leptospiraceae bacterium]|nr:sensor histidine kinase [Leptospiraceae bacterium]
WENIFIWSNLIAIFIGLFGIHYLRLVHYSTFLKKWIIFMVFILAFFFPILNYLKFIDFIFLVKAYLPTVTLFHFSLFLCGLYVYYKGYKPARFYTIAWGSLFLSIGIFFLIIHELLPFLLYADYIIYLGFTAEMAFFGLALGDRYNHIKKESEEIHKKHLVLIEKQKEILEQKVQERTEVLLLLNEELEQKNKDLDLRGKELQEVNRAKDKIFAIISHDLRSPIAALNSFLEIFSLKNIPPDKTLEYIDKLKNSIRNLQMTLDNLLQWAAGQLKGIKVEKQTFNILGVSESCRLLLQDIANTKGIQIQQEIPSDLEALADPEHIRLVLRNLLSNAIKFTEPGGTVSIQAVKVEGSIQLSVKDTGLGMSEELIANFTQNKLIQSQFGTQRESGTGLGLHLCKEFIELNGGEIRIKSKPGQGTKFIIKIPA